MFSPVDEHLRNLTYCTKSSHSSQRVFAHFWLLKPQIVIVWTRKWRYLTAQFCLRGFAAWCFPTPLETIPSTRRFLYGCILFFLQAYHRNCCANCKEIWALPFGQSCVVLCNQTTNRTETFFSDNKNVLRSPGRSISKIQSDGVYWSLALCVGLHSTERCNCYLDFLNHTKVPIIHDFPILEISAVLDKSFTRFAAEVMTRQCKLHLQEDYTVGQYDINDRELENKKKHSKSTT